MKTTIQTPKMALVFILALGGAALMGCSEDSGTAPSVSGPAPIVSNFEDGTEGWRGSGDYEGLRTSRTRPVQGYYLQAFDQATGGTWYFQAPAKFEGDKSRYYGGTLSYFLLAGLANGNAPTASDYFGAPDVIIQQAGRRGLTLEYRLPRGAYPDPNGFKEILVTLAPSPGWRVQGSGDRATAEQMATVLANVGQMFIRGEYFNRDDYGEIDEVYLEGPQ